MFTLPRAMWLHWCCAVRFRSKRRKVEGHGQMDRWNDWTCDRCGRNYRRDGGGTWRDWNPFAEAR